MSKKNVLFYIATIVLFAAIIGVKIININTSLWVDEAQTFYLFVDKGLRTILTDYSYFNNHILYNIILFILMKLFGFNEMVFRLPAYISGIVAVYILWDLLRNEFSRTSAIVSLILFLIYFDHTVLIRQARAYGLLFLFASLLLKYGISFLKSHNNKELLYLCVVSILGIYAYPFFISLVVINFLIIVAYNYSNFKGLFKYFFGTFICIAILYSPVILQVLRKIKSIKPQRTGIWDKIEIHTFLTYPADALFFNYFNSSTVRVFLILMTIVILLISSIYIYKKSTSTFCLTFLPSFLTFSAFYFLKLPAWNRYFSFFMITYIFAISIGIEKVINCLRALYHSKNKMISILLSVIFASSSVTLIYISLYKTITYVSLPIGNSRELIEKVNNQYGKDYYYIVDTNYSLGATYCYASRKNINIHTEYDFIKDFKSINKDVIVIYSPNSGKFQEIDNDVLKNYYEFTIEKTPHSYKEVIYKIPKEDLGLLMNSQPQVFLGKQENIQEISNNKYDLKVTYDEKNALIIEGYAVLLGVDSKDYKTNFILEGKKDYTIQGNNIKSDDITQYFNDGTNYDNSRFYRITSTKKIDRGRYRISIMIDCNNILYKITTNKEVEIE